MELEVCVNIQLHVELVLIPCYKTVDGLQFYLKHSSFFFRKMLSRVLCCALFFFRVFEMSY